MNKANKKQETNGYKYFTSLNRIWDMLKKAQAKGVYSFQDSNNIVKDTNYLNDVFNYRETYDTNINNSCLNNLWTMLEKAQEKGVYSFQDSIIILPVFEMLKAELVQSSFSQTNMTDESIDLLMAKNTGNTKPNTEDGE